MLRKAISSCTHLIYNCHPRKPFVNKCDTTHQSIRISDKLLLGRWPNCFLLRGWRSTRVIKRKAGHLFTSLSRTVIWTWSAFWSQMGPSQNRRTELDKAALVVRLFNSSSPMFAVLLYSFLDVRVYATCGKQGQPTTV